MIPHITSRVERANSALPVTTYGGRANAVVYFIQQGDGGPVKIGVTEGCASRRLDQLQVGSPEPLCLIGTVRGDVRTEQEFKERFARFRVRGEWFEPSFEIMNAIAALMRPATPRRSRPPATPQAERMRCLRLAMGFKTQAAFASWMSVSPARWNNVERGPYPVRRSLAKLLIEKIPGLSHDWINDGRADGLSVNMAARLDALHNASIP